MATKQEASKNSTTRKPATKKRETLTATTRRKTTTKKTAEKKSSNTKRSSGNTMAKITSAKTTPPKSTQKKSSPKSPKTKKLTGRLAKLKTLLIEERDLLFADIKDKSDSTNNTDTTRMHGDLVDQSSNFSELENQLGLAEHDRMRLKKIQESLEKIDDGTYGTCASCGCEIPEARLVAMPTAKLCVECKSKQEVRY